MKKTIVVILLIFMAIVVCIYMNYKEMMVSKTEALKFNKEFEFYNKEVLLGTDITTVINKAVDNNEQYKIPKDAKGLYIADDKNSIKIYVHMIINDETYPMEQLIQTGLSDFTSYFGEVEFKCSEIKYHEATGKISEMTFASTQL